jgi:hypothetical protein
VAALVREALGRHEVEIVPGRLGELSAWVDGRRVARRGWLKRPSDRFFFDAIQAALRVRPTRKTSTSGEQSVT